MTNTNFAILGKWIGGNAQFVIDCFFFCIVFPFTPPNRLTDIVINFDTEIDRTLEMAIG